VSGRCVSPEAHLQSIAMRRDGVWLKLVAALRAAQVSNFFRSRARAGFKGKQL
jgi:hypothetical protein